jgi:hypothetical protein
MTKPRRRKPRAPITGAVGSDFELTNERWSKVTELLAGGIPPDKADQARKALQLALGSYRLRELQRRAVTDHRKTLAAIRSRLHDLQGRFRQLGDEEAVGVLESLEDRYFVRAIEGEAGTPGPQTWPAYILVNYLMGFARRFAGKELKRPKDNAFVEYVCKIADPGITPRTIDSAMRHWSKRRGQTLDEASAEALGLTLEEYLTRFEPGGPRAVRTALVAAQEATNAQAAEAEPPPKSAA